MAYSLKNGKLSLEKVFKVLEWVIWLCLLLYCTKKIYDCYYTYSLGRISTSSYVINETPFEFPSFTACVNMDREITGAVGNMTWWSNEQYHRFNAFPFEILKTINDPFCW